MGESWHGLAGSCPRPDGHRTGPPKNKDLPLQLIVGTSLTCLGPHAQSQFSVALSSMSSSLSGLTCRRYYKETSGLMLDVGAYVKALEVPMGVKWGVQGCASWGRGASLPCLEPCASGLACESRSQGTCRS